MFRRRPLLGDARLGAVALADARAALRRTAPHDARRVLPAEGGAERLELLLQLPVPAAAAPARDHRALRVLPRSRRRRRRGARPGGRAREARVVAAGNRARLRRARRSTRWRSRCSRSSREFALPRGALPDGHRRHGRWTSTHTRYLDFAALELYCHRVAGVVGLMSAEIFGYADPATLGYARDLGIAFQLTNIIRDVGEDARRGRIYLPQDELARFGVAAVVAPARATTAPEFRDLMAFEVARARSWYDRALAQLPAADRERSAPGLVMAAIYRTLLDEIARDGYRVLDRRIALTPLRKLWIAWKTRARMTATPARRRHRRRLGRAAPRRSTLADARLPRHAVRGGAASSAAARAASSRDGLPLDNGQHLLLGAYAQTLRTARRACTRSTGAARWFTGAARDRAVRRRTARTALTLTRTAPAGAAAVCSSACCGAQASTWRERIANDRWFARLKRAVLPLRPTQRSRNACATLPRARARAACGSRCASPRSTRRRRNASAQVFANVLRAAFGGAPTRQRLPAAGDRSRRRCFPTPPRALVERGHGGAIRLGAGCACVATRATSGVAAASGDAAHVRRRDRRRRAASAAAAFASGADGKRRRRGAPRCTSRSAQHRNRSRRSISATQTPLRLPRRSCGSTTRPGQWVFDRADVLVAHAPSRSTPATAAAARGRHQRARPARRARPRHSLAATSTRSCAGCARRGRRRAGRR